MVLYLLPLLRISRYSQAASKEVVAKPAVKAKAPAVVEGAELIGITVPKEADFSGWYQQVLTKGDMLDYYDISGCYILKVYKSVELCQKCND